jgi:hypothetical protein
LPCSVPAAADNRPFEIWIVGTGATLLRGDGQTFTPFASNASPQDTLSSIWGDDNQDVWLASAYGGLIEHWDGAQWETLHPEEPDIQFFGTWGSGPNNVWVLGSLASGELTASWAYRWQDGVLTTVQLPYIDPLGHSWGCGVNDFWVGTDQAILHWDGATWRSLPGLPYADFSAVWGSGSTDIWFTGLTHDGPGENAAFHWDGSTLDRVVTSVATGPTAAWGSAPDDIWAVGNDIAHFDGKTWSQVPAPPHDFLLGIWGQDRDHVWAVGFNGTMMRWDGQAWSLMDSGTSQTLFAVTGLRLSQ